MTKQRELNELAQKNPGIFLSSPEPLPERSPQAAQLDRLSQRNVSLGRRVDQFVERHRASNMRDLLEQRRRVLAEERRRHGRGVKNIGNFLSGREVPRPRGGAA